MSIPNEALQKVPYLERILRFLGPGSNDVLNVDVARA